MFNDNNTYDDAIIYSLLNSSITFAASCKVTFNNNSGSAIYILKALILHLWEVQL